ncbi:MAG: NADH-quinone oxidoreductase subunit J [bacterium]
MAYGLMFYVVAALTLISSAVVVLSRNIIRAAFSLLFSFLGVGLLYALLSADFLAVVQLLLYVGGILVLILFAIMLTNRVETLSEARQTYPRGPAFLLCGSLFVGLLLLALRAPWKQGPGGAVFTPTTRMIGEALLGPYLLPFEIVSVLLLVGLIGAVVVARRESRAENE